jgi:transcription initiation factor TFIID TATA-box-binding protein
VQGYIVASTSLGRIDLDEASTTLENAIFEPEQFPDLIFRMKEPKIEVLLFSSGKLVCTAKTKEDVYNAIQQLHALVEEKALFA